MKLHCKCDKCGDRHQVMWWAWVNFCFACLFFVLGGDVIFNHISSETLNETFGGKWVWMAFKFMPWLYGLAVVVGILWFIGEVIEALQVRWGRKNEIPED